MLTGDGEIVVLPAIFLDELKHVPASILNSLEAQYQVHFMPKSFAVRVNLGCFTDIALKSERTRRLYQHRDKQLSTVQHRQKAPYSCSR